jgi:hypothetical protein
MTEGLKYNEATEYWLREQGFMVVREDELGLAEKTKKPDFLCKLGNCEFWMEVKSIELPERHTFHGRCYDEFKKRESSVLNPSRAFVTVADNTSDKDIKVALSLVSQVLLQEDLSSAENLKHYVEIPKDPVDGYNEFVRIEYETDEGKEVLHSVKSLSNKYSRRFLGSNIKFNSEIKIKCFIGNCEKGSDFTLRALDLLDETSFRISIQLMEGEDQFRICSVSHAIGFERSPNVKIFRNRSSDARKQIVSGNKQLGFKPGVVVFHHDNVFAADEDAFMSAFYGDKTYEWQNGEDSDGLLYYGRNGFWNETKNTTVSAAVYFRKDNKPILIHNHWAESPLPQGLLDCREYMPQDNGTFAIFE